MKKVRIGNEKKFWGLGFEFGVSTLSGLSTLTGRRDPRPVSLRSC